LEGQFQDLEEPDGALVLGIREVPEVLAGRIQGTLFPEQEG
jgi:hypothetical protein